MTEIFIADDDVELCNNLADICISRGYGVRTFESGENIKNFCQTIDPDLVLLDNQLPGQTGLDVLSDIRSRGKDYPVLIISGNCDREFILQALRAGADDYIVKPFDAQILVEKIELILRRRGAAGMHSSATKYKTENELKRMYDFTTNDSLHKVYVSGLESKLTPTEFKIFCLLVRAGGGVIERERLAKTVLGTINVTIRAVDVHVCIMRKKLGRIGRMIETIRGVGYRFRT